MLLPFIFLKVHLKLPVLIKLSALNICHQQTEQVHSDDFYLSPIIKGARLGSEYIRMIQWWLVFINFYQHC